jgi:ABC-type sugar transport system substrate-binding protein
MKTLASGLTVALLASFAVAAQQSSEPARAIVASYLEIQGRLAADRVEGVKAAAKVLTKQAAAIGKAGADIGKAASALEAAGTRRGPRRVRTVERCGDCARAD